MTFVEKLRWLMFLEQSHVVGYNVLKQAYLTKFKDNKKGKRKKSKHFQSVD